MDMQFHWLRCRDSQGQFRYFWASGASSLGNYSTKNHPPSYHLSKRKILQIAMYCPHLAATAAYVFCSYNLLQGYVDPQVIHVGFYL